MSEPPSIIRPEGLHEVSIPEGSQVAASRSMDPHGPQVRRTLASDKPASEAEAGPEWVVPPPVVAAAAPAQELPPPVSGAGQGPQEGIVFERSVHTDERLQVEAAPAQAGEPAGVPLPPAAPPAADGPVFQRVEDDHRIALPPSAPDEAADRHVRVEPRLLPDDAQGPAEPAPAAFVPRVLVPGREGVGAPVTVPPRAALPRTATRRPAENLPPVPLAQAQAQLAQTAADLQARVSETLGAADSGWVEMDFPARVVKLKIENDKVRSKLDQLAATATRSVR